MLSSPILGFFLFLLEYAADADDVIPNCFKWILANGFSPFFFRGKPVFSNGLRNVLRNHSDCTTLAS